MLVYSIGATIMNIIPIKQKLKAVVFFLPNKTRANKSSMLKVISPT